MCGSQWAVPPHGSLNNQSVTRHTKQRLSPGHLHGWQQEVLQFSIILWENSSVNAPYGLILNVRSVAFKNLTRRNVAKMPIFPIAIIPIIIVWFNIHHSLCIWTTTLWLRDWWWPRPPSDQLSVLYAYCMSHTTASRADRLCFALHLSPFICQRSHSHILLLCSAISDPAYCLWVQNGNLLIEVPNHIYLFIYLVFFSHCRALSEENGTGVPLKRAWWQTNPKKET